MSGMLIIGENEKQAIKTAIEKARARPTPLQELKKNAVEGDVLLLKDRPPGAVEFRREYPPQQVMLGSYRVALSFEEQPHGIVRHVSVSSASPGKIPGQQVLYMVCEAFGFSKDLCNIMLGSEELTVEAKVWLEEFEPGHAAVNVIEFEKAATSMIDNLPSLHEVSIKDKYTPAMFITEQDKADEYFKECVDHALHCYPNMTREEAEKNERNNLGYYAGYFSNEVRVRVERLFKCAHPIFGAIAEKGAPTVDQAFKMGQDMAAKAWESK